MEYSVFPGYLLTESNRMDKKQRMLFVLSSVLGTCFLYGLFIMTVSFAFDFSFDEPFYLSICERLLRGDRLVFDEWALPQFTAVFQFLPFYIFRKITGSTEGVILYMRYVFIATNFLTYCCFLYKLRKRPWTALTNAFLFCSFIPLCAYLLGYYYLPLVFMAVFLLIVNDERTKRRTPRLVLAGALLSCTVVLIPGTAVLWALYSVITLIRTTAKRRGKNTLSGFDYVLNGKTFVCLLAGVMLPAAALLVYFQIAGGLSNLLAVVPKLVMDSDGSRLRSVLSGAFLMEKAKDLLLRHGPFFWLALCVTAAVIMFRAVKTKLPNAASVKKALFFADCAVFAAGFLFSFIMRFHIDEPEWMEPPLLIAWLGLNCLLLCDRRDPKTVVCWLVGAALSAAQDITSETSCGFGCIICVLPSIEALVQLSDELTEAAKKTTGRGRSRRQKTKRRMRGKTGPYAVASVAAFSVMIAWAVTNVACFACFFRFFPRNESRYVVETGPYRGISLPENYKTRHDDIFADLDAIKESSDGSVYVMGAYAFAYLYLDRDIDVMSTGAMEGSEIAFEQYWQYYPERRPGTVYIPADGDLSPVYISAAAFARMPAEQYVDFGWFQGRALKGKAGLIVQVTEWGEATELKNNRPD